jgi:hypothetical protein
MIRRKLKTAVAMKGLIPHVNGKTTISLIAARRIIMSIMAGRRT